MDMRAGTCGEARGSGFPSAGVTDDGEALMWVLDPNLSPLESNKCS